MRLRASTLPAPELRASQQSQRAHTTQLQTTRRQSILMFAVQPSNRRCRRGNDAGKRAAPRRAGVRIPGVARSADAVSGEQRAPRAALPRKPWARERRHTVIFSASLIRSDARGDRSATAAPDFAGARRAPGESPPRRGIHFARSIAHSRTAGERAARRR